jgi:hypothetical protein
MNVFVTARQCIATVRREKNLKVINRLACTKVAQTINQSLSLREKPKHAKPLINKTLLLLFVFLPN